MRVSKLVYIGMFLLLVGSCIEPFQPEINETRDLLVISGNITDRPGQHIVEISRSSPYDEPRIIGVSQCVVQVEDDNGMAVNYSEYSPGLYRANLDESFLGLNKAYRLLVRTPDGQEYQSAFDSLLPGTAPDSLYFEVETLKTADSKVTQYGLQFYLDARGGNNTSRNFLWKLVETFEYNSIYLIEYIWDGDSLKAFGHPFDSLNTCYMTRPVNEFYTASTRYLVANELNRHPLNYVSNQTVKLRRKYSLLVIQHSLSDDAFLYWETMKNRLTETGGLYEAQPSGSTGNIININDNTEQVLGYFFASQVLKKRIIVKNNFDFRVKGFYCPLDTAFTVEELGNEFYYLTSISIPGLGTAYGYSDPSCFDCTLRGGTIERPPYWDDDE